MTTLLFSTSFGCDERLNHSMAHSFYFFCYKNGFSRPLTVSLFPSCFPAACEHKPGVFIRGLPAELQQTFPGEEATGSRRMIKTRPLLGQHRTPGFITPPPTNLTVTTAQNNSKHTSNSSLNGFHSHVSFIKIIYRNIPWTI